MIDEATLQLRTSTINGSCDVNAYSGSDFLNVIAVVSWTELTLTYSNMPSYNTTSTDSALVETSSQWYSWSVVNAVRNALNNAVRTMTIVLLPSLQGLISSISFNSKEFSIAEYAPTLTVHWSGIVPEFPTFLVLPLFMMATLLGVTVRKKSVQTRRPS